MDTENKLLELDDDMPPIDDELREAMEDLLQRQEKCLKLHKCLILLIVTCFWNPIGVIALFVNAIVSFTWGSRLSRKARHLARQAYPWLHSIPLLHPLPWIGSSRGEGRRTYISVDERIMSEAKESGDELTVKLLKFVNRDSQYMFIGMAGYIAVLMLFSGFVTRP